MENERISQDLLLLIWWSVSRFAVLCDFKRSSTWLFFHSHFETTQHTHALALALAHTYFLHCTDTHTHTHSLSLYLTTSCVPRPELWSQSQQAKRFCSSSFNARTPIPSGLKPPSRSDRSITKLQSFAFYYESDGSFYPLLLLYLITFFLSVSVCACVLSFSHPTRLLLTFWSWYYRNVRSG